VAELDVLLDRHPQEGTREDERLELLTMLIEAYDDAHHPMGESVTPQSIVEYTLEQQDKTRADLIPLLGSKSRVSEFMNGKRRLSLNQLYRVSEALKIPPDLLLERKPEFTYPAPALLKAAAVRERAPESKPKLDPELQQFLAQLIRALKEHDERMRRMLEDQLRELRALGAELRSARKP